MEPTAATSCVQCGQPIQKEELSQGLAVRVDGRLVCAQCVDSLPGAAQVRINQVRALRGMNATTYQVSRSRHPGLKSYTFTTSVNLNLHRRELRETGAFKAPQLSLDAPRVAPTAPLAAAGAGGARAPASGMRRPLFLGLAALGIGLAALGLVLVLAMLSRSVAQDPDPAALPAPLAAGDGDGVAPVAAPTRLSYAADPLAAWNEASQDAACPPDLSRAIADEVIAQRTRELDVAEREIRAGDRAEGARLLAASAPPDHILFRALRARADQLASLRPAAPVVAPPPAVPSAPIPPPTVVAVTPPPAAAVPPAAPPPEAPAPAPVPPQSQALLVPLAQLMPPADQPSWKGSGEGLRLDRPTGALERTLVLAGGTYQVWIQARSPGAGSFLQLTLGGTRLERLDGEAQRRSAWVRLAPDTVSLPPGPCRLQVVAAGKGWQVTRLYLAASDRPGPDAPEALAAALPPEWVQEAPAVVPAEPLVAIWQPRFIGAAVAVNPFDEKSRIPPGLPGTLRPFESSNKGRKKQALVLDLAENDTGKGGLVLLVHPLRPDRTQLQITLLDAQDRRLALPVVDVPQEWAAIPIAFAPLAGSPDFDIDAVKQVAVEDLASLTTSFLLAKVAVCANAAPERAMLDLRPPALAPIAHRDLERVLEMVAAKRKSRNWRRDLNPTLVKVLVGHQMLLGEWDTMVRRDLALALAEPLKGEKLPNRTLQALVLNDMWLNTMFTADDPPIATARHHVVVVCTAGVEFPVGLSEPQAFINFWMKMIDECIAHGTLPVVVLGPNKVDAADAAEVAKLWEDVEAYVRKHRPGVPLIDLRPARALSYTQMAPGMTRLSAQLIVDGYGELHERIRHLQKNPSR